MRLGSASGTKREINIPGKTTEMANEKQIIEVRHTATDLNVGDLKNTEWNKAQPVTINRYWSGDAAPAARHCEARILWSSKALHVRFVGHQAERLIINSTVQISKKTKSLWDLYL
jgi:hypothetical protein